MRDVSKMSNDGVDPKALIFFSEYLRIQSMYSNHVFMRKTHDLELIEGLFPYKVPASNPAPEH